MAGYKDSSDVIHILLFSLTDFPYMVVMRATRSPGLTSYLLSTLGRKTALSLISLAEKSQGRYQLATFSFLNQLLWPCEWNIFIGQVWLMYLLGLGETDQPQLSYLDVVPLWTRGWLLEEGKMNVERQK